MAKSLVNSGPFFLLFCMTSLARYIKVNLWLARTVKNQILDYQVCSLSKKICLFFCKRNIYLFQVKWLIINNVKYQFQIHKQCKMIVLWFKILTFRTKKILEVPVRKKNTYRTVILILITQFITSLKMCKWIFLQLYFHKLSICLGFIVTLIQDTIDMY